MPNKRNLYKTVAETRDHILLHIPKTHILWNIFALFNIQQVMQGFSKCLFLLLWMVGQKSGAGRSFWQGNGERQLKSFFMTSFLTFTDEALLAEASRKEDHQVFSIQDNLQLFVDGLRCCDHDSLLVRTSLSLEKKAPSVNASKFVPNKFPTAVGLLGGGSSSSTIFHALPCQGASNFRMLDQRLQYKQKREESE